MQFGKYNLIEKIGEGGLGEVFFAQSTAQVSFARELVIKRVHHRLAQDEEFMKRFVLAAEQGACLNHHNIVQTYESGVADGQHYVAQEFIDGLTLEAILDRHERQLLAIPFEITIEIILQVCEALTYAYWARDDRGRQLHMVHCNLKPSNIMINRHGVVKVCDFGLINAGHHMGAGQGSLMLRMAAYMSPEQAKGEDIDNRSDIFSLGAIFYEMLTLKPLFVMDNPLQTLRMVQEGRCEEQLQELAEHPVGKGLLPLLKSMLGASPWDRPTEAKQLIPHLRGVLSRLSQQAYLPNWIQEEMEALPTARSTIPVVGDAIPGSQGAEQTPPPPPGAGKPATSAAAPQGAPAPSVAGAGDTQRLAVAGTTTGAQGSPFDALAARLNDLLRTIDRKHIIVGAVALGVIFFGSVAMVALRGSGGETVVKEAGPTMTLLRVTSNPPGALVYVPGEMNPRRTPFEIPVPLAAGYTNLRATLDGYEPANARVLLRPNVVNQYNFVLVSAEQEMGTLELSVYPPEARVYLNDQLLEGVEGAYRRQLMADKPYVIKVEREGYATKEQVIRVPADSTKRVEIALDLLPEQRYVSP